MKKKPKIKVRVMRVCGVLKAFQWIMKWKGACPCIINLLPFPQKISRVKRQTKSEISDQKFLIYIKWVPEKKKPSNDTHNFNTLAPEAYKDKITKIDFVYHIIFCKGPYGHFFLSFGMINSHSNKANFRIQN